jgi:nucleoid-associated protein YgaU
MRSQTGLVAAVVVLAAGVGLATIFYRQSAPPAEATAGLEPIRHRVEDSPRFLMEVRSSPPPSIPAEEPPATPPRREQPLDRISGLPLFEADAAAVPHIAEHYPADDDSAAPPKPVETRHRVIDGDTLEALAQRYLGDAGRAPEIFEANREVLSEPELLPIGAVLKIPGR